MKFTYLVGGIGIVVSCALALALTTPATMPKLVAVNPAGVTDLGSHSKVPIPSTLADEATKADIRPGSYELYNDSVYKKALTGHVVLFFAASWCHTCKALSQDIQNNLAAIPSNVTISRVDYDSSTTLKQKYGITYQHVLVEVDAQGNLIKKWALSPTLKDLVAEI